jgi:hypothetical protein
MTMRAMVALAGCLALGGCLANTTPMPAADPGAEYSSYLLPRYGLEDGRAKSKGLLDWDREYHALYRQRGLSDRQAAAEAVAKGWRAVEAGQDSEAMRQFNLGWLADPEASAPYHGFAVILLSRHRPPEEVLREFDFARNRPDGSTDVIVSEAKYLASIGRRSEAFDLLLAALAQDPRARNVARTLEALSIDAGDTAGICRWGRLAQQNGDDRPSGTDFMDASCGVP